MVASLSCVPRALRTHALWALLFIWPIYAQEQISDPGFNTTVQTPAYDRNGPTVAIDEAHRNFHTAADRYKPLADLLKSDGHHVVAGTTKFEQNNLTGVDVLVIANAGIPVGNDLSVPAFTEPECDFVRDWVRDGGSLLLISDHAPWGKAAESLSQRFGVAMGKGWVFDRERDGRRHHDPAVLLAGERSLGKSSVVAWT